MRMKTIMSRILNEKDLNTVEQVPQFLVGTPLIAFQIKGCKRQDTSDRYRSLVLDDKARVATSGFKAP